MSTFAKSSPLPLLGLVDGTLRTWDGLEAACSGRGRLAAGCEVEGAAILAFTGAESPGFSIRLLAALLALSLC
jgi:hypothetical protein